MTRAQPPTEFGMDQGQLWITRISPGPISTTRRTATPGWRNSTPTLAYREGHLRNMSVRVDLVSIHDMETNQFLMELSHGKPFYNGGHRSRAVNNVWGPWMWTDGSKFDWTNWSTGDVEPNGLGDSFGMRGLDGRWYDSRPRKGDVFGPGDISMVCQFTPSSLPKGDSSRTEV